MDPRERLKGFARNPWVQRTLLAGTLLFSSDACARPEEPFPSKMGEVPSPQQPIQQEKPSETGWTTLQTKFFSIDVPRAEWIARGHDGGANVVSVEAFSPVAPKTSIDLSVVNSPQLNPDDLERTYKKLIKEKYSINDDQYYAVRQKVANVEAVLIAYIDPKQVAFGFFPNGLRGYNLYFYKSGKLYIISMRTDSSYAQKAEPVFDRVIKSFKFR